MAKITYLLGAGASFYACPILERQAIKMINMAKNELNTPTTRFGAIIKLNFNDDEKAKILLEDDRTKILWHIGYYGHKANEYNTIDTYAKKLYLNGEFEELRILKLCVSVFFDLFENNKKRFDYGDEYEEIDNRYKALFSILLEKNGNDIKLNDDFRFLTWNYDLQIEETFKLFLGKKYQNDLNTIDHLLKFKSGNTENKILHLNGYRGFYEIDNEEKLINESIDLETYWKNLEGFFDATKRNQITFNNHIKYAWEHNSDDIFFDKISNIMKETEVLVIIGYSFPAFNRKIDQGIFDNLNAKKIKKIVYQDPNATKELILNLFKNPDLYKDKIETLNDNKSLKQFYLPNDFFIIQEESSIEIK